jgi:hypothetical protein
VTVGDEGFVPNEIAQGGRGLTLGRQVVGGLLARAIEQHVDEDEFVNRRQHRSDYAPPQQLPWYC